MRYECETVQRSERSSSAGLRRMSFDVLGAFFASTTTTLLGFDISSVAVCGGKEVSLPQIQAPLPHSAAPVCSESPPLELPGTSRLVDDEESPSISSSVFVP